MLNKLVNILVCLPSLDFITYLVQSSTPMSSYFSIELSCTMLLMFRLKTRHSNRGPMLVSNFLPILKRTETFCIDWELTWLYRYFYINYFQCFQVHKWREKNPKLKNWLLGACAIFGQDDYVWDAAWWHPNQLSENSPWKLLAAVI